ncbi:FadR/GntR family transcriptional regulator [Subtercola boreus]|uniref:GntR family transcriptional regulator n=1 Tax=Subtercola boreus TaxID=120213 RepID=A0A3E0WF13_9MICO|nr:FCD domain-containing protein [Subtercola boreus]RFA22693.1 GntR family transcriptional regulator [Subtercola boreus]RFA23048.1 GntR family transcriptional regulator [Subtercola boreus]RFA28801.1 GntR family transcriptional regulator [Subtercola boreus]
MIGDPSLPGALAAATMLRPVRSGNAFEETVSRLLQTVRLGVIEPGGRLPPERELATMLSVSRDTVRDAIRSLSEAGYLVARRGRYGGTFVCDPLPATPFSASSSAAAAGSATAGSAVAPSAAAAVPAASHDDVSRRAHIDDVLILRAVLEVGAVRRAANRTLSADERADLLAVLRAVDEAAAGDYRRLDSRLHLLFGELAGSPSLVSQLADSRTRVNELLDEIPLLPRNITHSNRQHERIAAAIIAGDSEAAAQAMEEHLAGTETLLRGFLA